MYRYLAIRVRLSEVRIHCGRSPPCETRHTYTYCVSASTVIVRLPARSLARSLTQLRERRLWVVYMCHRPPHHQVAGPDAAAARHRQTQTQTQHRHPSCEARHTWSVRILQGGACSDIPPCEIRHI